MVAWRIIVSLKAYGATSSADLSQSIGMDKGLFSRNLKGLVAEGLVETRPDPSDQRRQLLRLTDDGSVLHARLFPKMRLRQQRLLEGIDRTQRDALFKAIDILERNALRTSL